MRIDQLLIKLKENDLKLPEYGTGRNSRILAKDLIAELGTHFAKTKYSGVQLRHLEMRLTCDPMKSYRYTKLSVGAQATLWEDCNEWVLEEKFNGWRMIITYIPEDGFMFWGGNTSDVDFLPVDYTEHILLNGCNPRSEGFYYAYSTDRTFDSEAICDSNVTMLDGRLSTNTLDAVKAILGSGATRAIDEQIAGHVLHFHIFDTYSLATLRLRRRFLEASEPQNISQQFHIVPCFSVNKKQLLHNLWKEGKEGAVLKSIHAQYEPGSRKRGISVKVKRSMSGAIGDDLDAFVFGSIQTKEWSKKGLIGGVKLGVFVGAGLHHIATVTSMPDSVRVSLTDEDGCLDLAYLNKVLVVDGQELSAKNRMILHATVDWDKGFRADKSSTQCTFDFGPIDNERF